MFHDIPQSILDRMHELEQIDSRDRTDGTTRTKRLRQIPPEVGRFIALLAASAPAGRYLEVGTSAGYSTLWLVLACRLLGRRVTTYEVSDDKAELARRTFAGACVTGVVDFVHGDALAHLPSFRGTAFCFLDAEKEIYGRCYDLIVPHMVPGGILVADNAINHQVTLQPMLDQAMQDDRVDALIVPIGKGELVCRKR